MGKQQTVGAVTAKLTGELKGLRFTTLRGNVRVVTQRVMSTDFWETEETYFTRGEDRYWETPYILANLVD